MRVNYVACAMNATPRGTTTVRAAGYSVMLFVNCSHWRRENWVGNHLVWFDNVGV